MTGTKCGVGYGFSSYCRLPLAHEGLHSNGVFEWDAEAAAESRRAILAAMKGNTE